jgi:hypothetical protein
MNTNIPSALRPLFTDPVVQQYLRDHDPATLDKALNILSKSDEDVTPIETLALAHCAGTRNDAGSPSPIAHPGIGDRVNTALARAGIQNLGELFAMARAQGDAHHAAQIEKHADAGGNNLDASRSAERMAHAQASKA